MESWINNPTILTGIGIASEQPVTARAASFSLLDSDAGGLSTNVGAGAATVVAELPAASATNQIHSIKQVDAGKLGFDPRAGVSIFWSGGDTGPGQILETNGIGSSITVVWDGTRWLTTIELGTLQEAP